MPLRTASHDAVTMPSDFPTTNPTTIAHINRPLPRKTSDDHVTPALASAKIGSTT
jgi:hypothetical protein